MRPPPKVVRIFLVEDASPDEGLVAEMLREYGGGQFILSGLFRSLGELIEGLKTAGEVDLVLLDLSLPDAHGIDAFLRFSHAAPHLPVIVLSNFDDEEMAADVVYQGAQDFLVKFDLTGKMLVRSINYAIERKRGQLALQAIRDELEKRVSERTQALMESNQHLSEALNQSSTAQAQMIQQERLHAMERMASGVAHDFNNALSPILAHSEWLLRKPETLSDESGVKKALCKIHESAEYCSEIVMRLRGFYRSRDESSSLEPLDLSEVLREAICLTQMYWKDQAQMRGCNITVETSLAKVPKIDGTRNELRQMFTDLILNAVDAIVKEGVITASIFPSEGGVAVSIADNGMGMSEEVCARCMEPFFTTKNHAGIGLGLGVVHGITQRHNGEIKIKSKEGQGTTVTVRFPASEIEKTSSEPSNPQEQFVQSTPLAGLRILVVEDEPNIREILAVYLAEDGHEVELASEGTEALTKFKKDRFDLLLTDYSMPHMNGDQLAAEVRAADPMIRVALLTGFGSSLPQGAPLRLEVDAIIPKPFTFESLRAGIAEAMQGHKARKP